MNLFIAKKKYLLVFLTISVVVFACTKIITTDIGGGLIPPIDGVITKDTTLDVLTKNSGQDTVIVPLSDDHIVGFTDDPVLGKTMAAINIQLKPQFFPFTFGAGKDSLFFDSVVLQLDYKGFTGDSTVPLGLHVKTIDPEQYFAPDSTFNNTIDVYKTSSGTELTEGAASIDIRRLGDSVRPFMDSGINLVRIKLSDTYGRKLLYDYDTSDVYNNDTAYSLKEHGIQICGDASMGNALLRIGLFDQSNTVNPRTKMIVYYRFTDTSGNLDTASRIYVVNPYTSAHSNYIKRDRTAPAKVAAFFPANSDEQDAELYIQTNPGLYSTIQIPAIAGLPNMVIHRAELLIEQIPDETGLSDTYFAAPNLFLAAYSTDSMRRLTVPNDIQFSFGAISNLGSFGVAPIAKINNEGKSVKYYNFDISRYVQGVVTRKEKIFSFVLYAPYNGFVYPTETGLYAVNISSPSLNPVGLGRVRVAGGNYSDRTRRMRLHIIYSKI